MVYFCTVELKISCKKFEDLSLVELYRILQIRNQVFYVEQRCSDLDLDDRDQQSYHLCFYDGAVLCAYARLLPPGLTYEEKSIGRVAVHFSYRQHGMGRKLMNAAIDQCEKCFGKGNIKISAQLYLQKFYESLGFQKQSAVYLEAGIEHIKMVRVLKHEEI